MAEDGSRHDADPVGSDDAEDRPAETPPDEESPAETREQPALSEPPAGPPAAAEGDETVVAPADLGPTGTGVLPTVPDGEPAPPRWSARARVPSPDLDREPPPIQWEGGPEREPRGYLVPILITICALLLLSLIGVGVWLILRGRGAVEVPTPTVPATTPAPITTAPTTQPAVTPTTTAAPVPVAIPDLQGKDYDSAAKDLTNLGLVPKRRGEANASVPAGHVIGTDPPAGSQVLPGGVVTIILSTGPPTPPPTTEPPATPAPS